MLVAFWLAPLEAFGMLLHRADVFVKNDVLRGRGTANFREPPRSSPFFPVKLASGRGTSPGL
jgi:hypothetical protein